MQQSRGRARAFYFQGLPVQAYKASALVNALDPHLDLELVTYVCWLDRPARENLDLARGFNAAVTQIEARQPEGTINLIGYSIGGYAAMAVARQLAERGRTLGFVALLDSSSYFPFKEEPSLIQRLRSRGSGSIIGKAVEHLLVTLLTKRYYELARWLTLLAILVRGRVRAGNLVSKTLALYWKEAVLRLPPRRYSGRITLFAAERGRPRITDPLLGWGPYAAEIDKVVLQGDHWTLAEDPHAEANARTIVESLGLHSTAPGGAPDRTRPSKGRRAASR